MCWLLAYFDNPDNEIRNQKGTQIFLFGVRETWVGLKVSKIYNFDCNYVFLL